MRKIDLVLIVLAALLMIVAIVNQDFLRAIAWSCYLLFGILSSLNSTNIFRVDLMGIAYVLLVISVGLILYTSFY